MLACKISGLSALLVYLFLMTGGLAAATSSVSPAQLQSHQEQRDSVQKSVSIFGRQLIVDGAPFIMKGICYNPIAKGKNHPEGLIFLKPTRSDLIRIDHDFKLMSDAGINTIRTYEPMVEPRVLSLLLKYHLRTIVPICATYNKGLYAFSSAITTLKNHPSTLLWEIGNEWNIDFFYTKLPGEDTSNKVVLSNEQCIAFVKNIAAFIRTQDTSHPISTSLGDAPVTKQYRAEIKELSKYVDLFGATIYDGLGFGDRFADWKKLSNKPLYIGECGADSFNNLTSSYDPKSQAFADASIIKEAFKNLSAKNPHHVLVGLCMFEWCDEWWKCKEPKESLRTHTTTGYSGFGGGPYPDQYFNEEWFGIFDIDRHPRPAYRAIKQLYTTL